MKLTYRGISYEYNPAEEIETTKGTPGGKYRGLDWRFRNLKKPPILQPRVSLTYRGVKYERPGTNISVVAQPPLISTPVLSTQDRARSLMLNSYRTQKKRQQAMLSRVAKEVGLAEIAAQY